MRRNQLALAQEIATHACSFSHNEPQDESAVRLALALLGFRLSQKTLGDVSPEKLLLEMTEDERFLVTVAEVAFLQLVKLNNAKISEYLSSAIDLSDPVFGPGGRYVMAHGQFSWGALQGIDFKELLSLRMTDKPR
jgi:hypothetical protein